MMIPALVGRRSEQTGTLRRYDASRSHSLRSREAFSYTYGALDLAKTCGNDSIRDV